MNKKIWAGLACSSLLVGLSTTGCKEESAVLGDSTGYLTLALNFDPSPVKGPRADRSRADEMSGESDGEKTPLISESDLSITLSRVDGATPPEELTIEDLSEPKTVYTGDYTIEAFYGSDSDEGWDKPYYYGSQEFSVSKGSETKISLPVKLANSIVNIAYTDAFVQYLDNYTVTVTSSSGTDYVWQEGNSQELYILPGTILLTVEFTKPNGTQATVQIDPFEANAQHRYTITLDADYGDESLTVTTDDTIDEKEYDIDISDANLPNLAPKPIVLVSEDFTLGMDVNVVSGNKYNTPIIATVVARGGIKSAQLAFESDFLTSKGITSPVELTEDNANLNKLIGLGLATRGLTGRSDVFAIVDFSKLVANITYLEGKNNSSSFSLTVTDKRDQSSDQIDLFTLNIEKIKLEILEGSVIKGEGRADVIVKYNGASPENIKLFAYNDRGTVGQLKIASYENGTAEGTYRLIVEDYNRISADGPITIYAEADGKLVTTPNFILDLPPVLLEEKATNAFAKYAYVTVRFNSTESAANYKNSINFEAASDSKNFKAISSEFVSDNFSRSASHITAVYKLSGLTPATNYALRAVVPNVETTDPVTLTTEKAAELNNKGLDEWECDKKGDYQYLWYPSTTKNGPWNTVNNLTISTFGSGSGNGLSTGGCAYKATSGTIPANSRSNYSNSYGGLFGTTKKSDGNTAGNKKIHDNLSHTGENAALIRTVGYGSGNSAGAGTGNPASGFSTCQNVAAGELYYGFKNESAYTGYTFGSRPSKLTFWYKYVPYGSSGDYGECEVILTDASDNVIFKSEIIKIDEVKPDYDIMEIPFSYSANAPKAAKIMVRFKSSANPDLTNNSTWLYGPGNKNVSGGEYVGSELYIDDVELIY